MWHTDKKMIAPKTFTKNQCLLTVSASKKNPAAGYACERKSLANCATQLKMSKPASDFRTKRAMACCRTRPRGHDEQGNDVSSASFLGTQKVSPITHLQSPSAFWKQSRMTIGQVRVACQFMSSVFHLGISMEGYTPRNLTACVGCQPETELEDEEANNRDCAVAI